MDAATELIAYRHAARVFGAGTVSRPDHILALLVFRLALGGRKHNHPIHWALG
eukprot:CAMPEP_0119435456 /NCGR_PEP_ID=MMETSP1335-20130426/51180_1 /TAXON_ID=259385 /ORGANISM="Chrysoculter rhomboideus, Strain RCC1486" /LENGTH=52 /DNA_ID=CAMNT_0007461317 /DNA_START=108 /DNA_END=266 /DNA_ORIENTATION=+